MLIELSIKNFASFREENMLSMIATSDNTNEEEQINAVGKNRVVKNAVIYGANASGKSNILKAMYFFKSFVINSSKESQLGDEIEVTPFRFNLVSENEPTLMEVVFSQENIIYRYGFEATRDKVVSEWLFARYSSRESKLFVRDGQEISLGDRFKEGKKYQNSVRKNALFISVCAQFNGEISSRIIKWFRKVKVISSIDNEYVDRTIEILKNEGGKYEKQKNMLLELITGIDVGIEDIVLEKTNVDIEVLTKILPTELANKLLNRLKDDNEDDNLQISAQQVSSLHKKYDSDNQMIGLETCEFNIESRGTKKVFELAGPIIDTLVNGGVLFIDEIQNSLHTKLVEGLLRFILKYRINNEAQFVITTHDVNILRNQSFRRDQFWFVEKNEYGESDLTALTGFNEHIRKDALLDKDYLRGRYGAIPYLRF